MPIHDPDRGRQWDRSGDHFLPPTVLFFGGECARSIFRSPREEMEVAEQCASSQPAAQLQRCQFWLPSKRRQCANSPLPESLFCGNHDPTSAEQRVPCPIDPSHSVLKKNLDAHMSRCPFKKNTLKLEAQSFYKKGINYGGSMCSKDFIKSKTKRSEIHQLTIPEFLELVKKIKFLHSTLLKEVHLPDSFKLSKPCSEWLEGSRRESSQTLPFQEKHALQQASIIGNMETFGLLNIASTDTNSGNSTEKDLAVVEFGAGRGYLTQMLTDCYGIRRVYLVERRSYKLKADRSLRQKDSLSLERIRIDIEDLDLEGVESLRGCPYLAIGKHLCGPATDLTLRCCLRRDGEESKPQGEKLRGLTLATCCHHLCQWDQYIGKAYFSEIGFAEEQFNAITWFSSWAVDGAHSSEPTEATSALCSSSISLANGVQQVVRQMPAEEKAALGIICKEIIDVGRLLWLKARGLKAELVKYVPCSISPENHLLLAR